MTLAKKALKVYANRLTPKIENKEYLLIINEILQRMFNDGLAGAGTANTDNPTLLTKSQIQQMNLEISSTGTTDINDLTLFYANYDFVENKFRPLLSDTAKLISSQIDIITVKIATAPTNDQNYITGLDKRRDDSPQKETKLTKKAGDFIGVETNRNEQSPVLGTLKGQTATSFIETADALTRAFLRECPLPNSEAPETAKDFSGRADEAFFYEIERLQKILTPRFAILFDKLGVDWSGEFESPESANGGAGQSADAVLKMAKAKQLNENLENQTQGENSVL